MGANEEGTLAAPKRHRETVFDSAVAANDGRLVKLIGDGTIVEFGGVVDAVNCTRRIVDALKVILSPAQTARLAGGGTPNIDAYDCYLRGRELLAPESQTARGSNSRQSSL